MRIKVTQPVLDYEGSPILIDKTKSDGSIVLDENSRPVKVPETARQYMVTALNNKARHENEPIGAEEGAKRYQLSTKLYAKNEVDLTLDELSLIKARVVALYGDMPLIVGRITDMLEGKEPTGLEKPAAAEKA